MTRNPQTKTALVLGASGKLGRMMCALGSGPDLRLIPVYRRPSPQGLIWSPGQTVPDGLRCDVVLALWGVTGGALLDLNTELAVAAQRLAKQTGADRVLHCSSMAVYEPRSDALSETSRTAPIGDYGAAKLAMERALSKAPAPRPVFLRIGNVAGADSLFAAGRAQGRITLTRYPDGHSPLRSYIAPSDLARVLRHLALANLDDLPNTLNVAAPHPVRMGDLAQAMGWPIDWKDVPDDGRQVIVMQTDRLSRFVPPNGFVAAAQSMAQDVRAGGWHL